MHGIDSLKKHKVEAIPEGVAVHARCPLHGDNPLEVFCIDEIKLSCAMCKMEKLHKGHKIFKISDILQDNETFSAADTKNAFTETLRGIDELERRLKEAAEALRREVEAAQKEVKATFEGAHRRLNDEEGRVMKELEKAFGECEDALQGKLRLLRETCEYGRVLSEANAKCGKGGFSSSRLMELNLVSEMEEQRRIMEELRGTVMTGLRVAWDSGSRKLAYTKTLINGAPVPKNVRTASSGLWEADIAWECDLSKISREIKGGSSSDVRYVVEIKKKNEDEEGAWKEVYSGKDTKCTAKNLAVDTDTEYGVRVKCVVNGLESAWSGAATMKTRKVSVRNVRVTGTTRDAITVAWDAAEGASSYQIEVDGGKSLESATKNTFTKTGLPPDTEHSLRVRAVRGSTVSGWSGAVKGRTQKELLKTSA